MLNTRILSLFSRNKRMIAGNWKSNFTHNEALKFVSNTVNNIKYDPDQVGTTSSIKMSSLLPFPSIFLKYSTSMPTSSIDTLLLLRIVQTMD